MARQRLTDIGVKAAKAKGARTDIWDKGCPSLVLRVTEAGRKTWFFFYWHEGKKRRTALGSANEGGLSLGEARKKATALHDIALSGEDPAIRRFGKPRNLGDLVARYERGIEAQQKRSWKEQRRILAKDVLPRIGRIELERLRKADVLRVVDRIAERGALRVADMSARILSAIFNWAIDEDIITMNPAQRIRRRSNGTKARERVLSPAEIRDLWCKLPAIYSDEQRQMIVRLILLTGCRKMEVQAALSSEFLLEEATPIWVIPGSRTKNSRTHTLPLSQAALKVVRTAFASARGGHLLFPAPGTGAIFDEGALNKGLMRAFRPGSMRVRDATGSYRSEPRAPILAPARSADGPYTIHDLRRTVTAQLKEMGISPDVRKLILNHSPQGVTAIHYEGGANMLPQMQLALESWSQRLASIVEERTTSDPHLESAPTGR
jgi:integrase